MRLFFDDEGLPVLVDDDDIDKRVHYPINAFVEQFETKLNGDDKADVLSTLIKVHVSVNELIQKLVSNF